MQSSPVRRVFITVLLVLATLPAAVSPAQETGEGNAAPTMQGLPPAPPPSGIRRSRAAADRPPETRHEAPQPDAPAPRRAESSALDLALTVEVRGMAREAADAALRAAIAAVRELEELIDPRSEAADGLAALNAAAGGEAMALDPRLIEMLERALSFCTWSQGAHGPLGGTLYEVWGLRTLVTSRPTPARLQQATQVAACDRLLLDPASGRVRLAPGARVDTWGFATGWLVDAAMETLLDHGAEDALVELGWVRRAIGSRQHTVVDGPLAAFRSDDGERGWPVTLPSFPGQTEAMAPVWLRDEAMSVTSSLHRPLLVAGDRYPPWIDQRDGTPASGVTAVVTVTERALDAQALGASLMILGNREGLVRVGGLKPQPAVLWLLGSGQGKPVLNQYNWSHVGLR